MTEQVYPNQRALQEAILQEVAAAGGRVRPSLIYAKVATRLNVPDSLKSIYYAGDERTPRWIKDQQWARQALVNRNELDPNVKREWAITTKGRLRIGVTTAAPVPLTVVKSDPEAAVDERQADEFRPVTSPTIANLAAGQEAAVRQALLGRVKELSPSEFERLVGKVLEALGFPVFTITGRTGDEGVDGECEMPVLDLKVAFQAKRYTANSVGGPQMAEFRGRITGRYERGIYITTSTFTHGAKEMAEHPGGVKILLVDGDGLVERMLKHGIGVKAQPLVLKQLDEEFFTGL